MHACIIIIIMNSIHDHQGPDSMKRNLARDFFLILLHVLITPFSQFSQ